MHTTACNTRNIALCLHKILMCFEEFFQNVVHVHGMKACRGSTGVAPFTLKFGTRWEWLTSHSWLLMQGNTLVSIRYEAGCAPERVWMFWRRKKSFFHTGIRTPDHPARSQSLYRLRYSDSIIPNSFTHITLKWWFLYWTHFIMCKKGSDVYICQVGNLAGIRETFCCRSFAHFRSYALLWSVRFD